MKEILIDEIVLFFPHQIEPSAHHGPVLKKGVQKKYFQNDCISPRHMICSCDNSFPKRVGLQSSLLIRQNEESLASV